MPRLFYVVPHSPTLLSLPCIISFPRSPSIFSRSPPLTLPPRYLRLMLERQDGSLSSIIDTRLGILSSDVISENFSVYVLVATSFLAFISPSLSCSLPDALPRPLSLSLIPPIISIASPTFSTYLQYYFHHATIQVSFSLSSRLFHNPPTCLPASLPIRVSYVATTRSIVAQSAYLSS